MAGLTSTMMMIVFFLIGYMSIGSSATNNTTQFDNYTIVWEDFNLLTCAVPLTINISLFTCLPPAGYTQVNDIDCLQQITTDFDESICQSTSTAVMYTSSTLITAQQTTKMASSVTSIQTSTGMTPSTTQSTPNGGIISHTSATTGGTYVSTIITISTATTTKATDTSITSNVPIHSSITATTIGSSNTTVTTGPSNMTVTTGPSNTTVTTGSSNTTVATGSSNTTVATGSSNTTVTTGPSNMTVTTGASNTTVTAGPSNMTVTTGSGSAVTATTTYSNRINATTAIGSTITTTPGNIYECYNGSYIGVYCNLSSDACAMSQPCLNAATCFPNNTIPAGYICQCQTGFTGYNCQNNENACFEGACWNNGTCIPVNATVTSNNGLDFKCDCVEGYDGIYCQLDIDLCNNITCENGGMCQTVDFMWKCTCLDSAYYYGIYCQLKTNKLVVLEVLSKSFASIAIAAIITTCLFIVIMDILKYIFHIDPVRYERNDYRKRIADRRRARQAIKNNQTKLALRFQYVS